MRTRRSPRNQERLWRILGAQGAPVAPVPTEVAPRYECGNCSFFKSSATYGNCAKVAARVRFSETRDCFEPKPHVKTR